MLSESAKIECWLVRPSVSIVPLGDGVIDFFQSTTRRSIRFRVRPEILGVITDLDGRMGLTELCLKHNALDEQLEEFINVLHERCIVEPRLIRDSIDKSAFYRVLNFLGDYFPAGEVFSAFDRIRSARVVVLGCGAVGSWVAVQLAHSGFESFTLIDGDVVEESNLNRSVFLVEDIGTPKVQALKSAICRIDPSAQVNDIDDEISDSADLADLLSAHEPEIVVNCADQPSVDLTSHWVDEYCFSKNLSYVIAGGYNLHLSLIGMTVTPGISACYKCSRITLDESEDTSLRGIRKLWRPKRNLGSLAPLTGITSALAASEVLRLAVKSTRLSPAMWNRRGEFNFLTNELSFVDLPPRKECGCTEVNSGGFKV